jgi:hypothetical protein
MGSGQLATGTIGSGSCRYGSRRRARGPRMHEIAAGVTVNPAIVQLCQNRTNVRRETTSCRAYARPVPCISQRRIAVEERDGRVHVGAVPVYWCDHIGHLEEDCAGALGLCNHARLHRCTVCQARFIGHWSARACSDACQRRLAARALAKHRTKRREWRKEPRREFRCEHCGACSNAFRSTRRYCSPSCRQQAYRKRSLRRQK